MANQDATLAPIETFVEKQGLPFDVLFKAGLEADHNGDLETAASQWLELRRLFPDNPAGFQFGGRALKRLGRFSEALSVLSQGIRQFPDDEWLCVEHAWVLYDLADFSGAVARFRDIRELIPDSLSGYLGGGASFRRLGAFDEADQIYRAGVGRFDDSEVMRMDYAWSAEERGDIPEAIRRWKSIRERFPAVEVGYVREGVLLMNSGRLDEADAVLEAAVRRFPDSSEALTSYAWVAHERRHWPEALIRWEPVIARFPQLRDPRRLCAQALMELGRYIAAQHTLAPALRMYPDDPDLAVLNGWLATRRRNLDEAASIWRSVRERFPDLVDGYLGYALALREVGQLDEADAVLADATRRFPKNSVIAMDFAQLPERKQDWSLAAVRWRDVLSRFPDVPGAYIGLGNSLYRAGNVTEAKAVYKEGLARFPEDDSMVAAEARLATSMNDLPKALQLWTTVRARFPDLPVGYLGLGETLRNSGQADRSAMVISQALTRFPENVELEVQYALTLSALRDWPKALARWELLKKRYPNHSDVRWGISQILDKAISDQAVQQARFEIPQILLESDSDASEHIKAHSALLRRFESLGDSCEFAMVQRIFEVDHVSLLRWAWTPPDELVTALDNRFEGVGDPEHTIIAANGDEYTTEDRRYSMHSHTFTSPTTEPIEHFAPEQCRRIQWLRQRLIDNLTAGRKIFIYKHDSGLSDADIDALYAALCRYCPEIVLLCVRIEDPSHASGKVDRIRGGLFVGYIDKFSTLDISVGAWIALCRGVAAELPNGVNRIVATQ